MKKFLSITNRPILLAILCLLSIVFGCHQKTSTKLSGKWIGRPDTAVARAARESDKFDEVVSEEVSETVLSKPEADTDWEKYDVAVIWDFVSNESLEMSLVDGSQPILGHWEIISLSPIGCTIEVVTLVGIESSSSVAETVPSDKNDGEKVPQTRRRFEIELDERDGECVGFLLYEAGADRQLGAIYFSRPDKTM